MKIFLILICIWGLSLTAYCQTEDIKASATEVCVNFPIDFEAAKSRVTWFWDFGDGNGITSDQRTPQNTYTTPGTYNVAFRQTLTGSIIKTIQIKVYAKPVLSVTATAGCAPVDVTLQASSAINSAISISNYNWSFGDGQSTQGLSKTIVHKYLDPKPYDVTLGITTNVPGCDVTQILPQAVKLLSPPTANFKTNPLKTDTCANSLDVTYTNTTTFTQTTTYAWVFGNGNTSTSSTTPPKQTYTSGNYTAKLTASYKGIAGCTTSTTKDIKVGRPPVVISAVKDSICIYDQAILSTTTPGSYLWDIAGGTASSLTANNVSISFSTPGTKNIKLKVTTPDGQCSDTKTYDIYVDPLTAAISPLDTFTCESPANILFTALPSNLPDVTYEWHFDQPAQTILNVSTVNKSYRSQLDSIYYSINALETFTTQLVMTSNLTGCKATASTQINMWLPNAQFKVDLSKGCAPLNVTFADSSSSLPDQIAAAMGWSTNQITNWEWIFGDGQTQSNLTNANVQHTYATKGEYEARLVITTQQGCTDTSYAVLIEVGTTVTGVDFTSDKTQVCLGEDVEFSLNYNNPSAKIDGYHFVADGNKVFHCADSLSSQKVTWSYNDKVGLQDISLQLDYNGCYTTITKNNFITVNGAIAKIDYYALCNQPMDYHFESLYSNNVVWDFGDGQTSTSPTVTNTYTDTLNYTVKLTTNEAGCPISDSVTVSVKKVKAKISIDTLLCINQPYIFKASTSLDVYANCYSGYTWQFPDVTNIRPYTSAQSDVFFTFSEKGVHTVKLIVKDINGCRDTASMQFKVYDIDIKAPSVSKTDICNPSDVVMNYQLNPLTTSVGDTALVSWKWDFDDGNTLIRTDTTHFTHTYNTNPPNGQTYFHVVLTLTDSLHCKESSSFNINFYKPTSAINISPKATLCLGDEVTLSANDFPNKNSHLSYSWDFGNGQKDTTAYNELIPPIAYTVGNKTVKLVYTEISTGCKDSTTAPISVQSYPTAIIHSNNDTVPEICAPKPIQFYRDSIKSAFPYTYTYDYGNGQQYTDRDSLQFGYDKGMVTIKLSVSTTYGCKHDTSRTYTLFRPDGKFTMDKDQICRYDEIRFSLKDTVDVTSYKWQFGDGIFLSNQDSVYHKYDFHPPSGQTMAKILLYKGSCPNDPIYELPVHIYEVIANFDILDSAKCFQNGESFEFKNTSVGDESFAWYFGDNTSTKVEYDPNPHTYSQAGIYDVTLAIADHQCVDTIRKKVYFLPNPIVRGYGDTVCLPTALADSVNLYVLNPTPESIYTWSPSASLSDANDVNPKANIQYTTTYGLKEENEFGCIDSTEVTAFVIRPDAFSDWDTTIVIGDYATLPSSGYPIYQFAYTPGDYLTCQSCNYPKANPLKDQEYIVNVTDIKGCFDLNYLYSIKIRPETFIKMPSAFTPNGSGQNDILYVRGWGIKDLISFQVFNRWGQEIFKTSELEEGWDGRFKGTMQNEDVYVYKVKVSTWRDEELYEEGYVNLLH